MDKGGVGSQENIFYKESVYVLVLKKFYTTEVVKMNKACLIQFIGKQDIGHRPLVNEQNECSEVW